jgi:hypothetical protein
MAKRKRSKASIKSEITASTTSSVKADTASRQFRDRKTFVMSPIKPKDTHALQWNRWSP